MKNAVEMDVDNVNRVNVHCTLTDVNGRLAVNRHQPSMSTKVFFDITESVLLSVLLRTAFFILLMLSVNVYGRRRPLHFFLVDCRVHFSSRPRANLFMLLQDYHWNSHLFVGSFIVMFRGTNEHIYEQT